MSDSLKRTIDLVGPAVVSLAVFWNGLVIIAPAIMADDVDEEFFESKIRPILIERCGSCHGESAGPPAGGLNVASRTMFLKGGDSGPAIVAGHPDDSLLIDAINYRGLYEMPPDSKLSDSEIQRLTDWVAAGAPWPDHDSDTVDTYRETFDLADRQSKHWCWRPIETSRPPPIQQSEWPLDPLDCFILHRLEAAGLTPAADADRRMWIRRVYFDLIGLPPEPAAVEAFLRDTSDDAWSKVVDDLLASQHFGERWARHWMDLVRFAESYGHEFDYSIDHAYQYRDYLIRAFNADVPYDELVREHIAGDLIRPPRRHPQQSCNESILGTGFWFLGEATHGPVDVKADEAGRIDNQIDVLSKTFLGLTVACARCHDHKFDAISIDDYYALSGILQSSRQQIALLDPGQRIQTVLHEVRTELQSADRWLANWLDDHDGGAERSTGTRFDDSIDWQSVRQLRRTVDPGHPFHLLMGAAGVNDDDLDQHLEAARDRWQAQERDHIAFRQDSVPFEDFDQGIPSDWFVTGWAFDTTLDRFAFSAAGPLILPASTVSSGRHGTRFTGVLRSPTFELTHDQILIRARGRRSLIRLIIDGYQMDVHNPLLFHGCRQELDGGDEFTWLAMSADIRNYRGHRAWLEFIDHGDGYFEIDEIRFADLDCPPPADAPSRLAQSVLTDTVRTREQLHQSTVRAVLDFLRMPASLPATEGGAILDFLLRHHSSSSIPLQFRERLERLTDDLPMPTRALAMTEGSGEDEYLFIRGNPANRGPQVPRRFLTALRPIDPEEVSGARVGSGRQMLAEQMVDERNPLTRRVIVNRIWHHLFGVGIVSTVDNFGALGKPPTHPELLDYLASEFARQDWSIKTLIRRLVLSRTYRMSSRVSRQGSRVDPANTLLHRARVRRLQGEAIRDAMLKIAGNLDETMYGPSVPVYLTPHMQGRGRPAESGPLDGNGRRSIYLEVRRNFLSPMMLAFDTPIPFNTVGQRHQSNVPAQALTLMNDPFVIQQATRWAEQVVVESNDPTERIDRMFMQALSRRPTADERKRALQFVQSQNQLHSLAVVSSENEQKTWRDLCHALFNLKEFIFIP